jgi:cytidine deaminase
MDQDGSDSLAALNKSCFCKNIVISFLTYPLCCTQGGFFISILIMKKEIITFEYEAYEDSSELSAGDQELLEEARQVTKKAYAPYSNFLVGAVARLQNGEKISGTNQENASYPVGICAERVLLSAASVIHTNVPIETMAISYNNTNGLSDHPISPCGMCRQALREYEERTSQSIRLILSGITGKVFIVEKATQLLPFSFSGNDMKPGSDEETIMAKV